MIKSVKRRIGLIALEMFMLLASLIVVIPLLIMIFGSLKNPAEAAQFSLALPTQWRFENFYVVFKEGGIANAMKNSFLITSMSVAIIVISSALCSFVITRKKSIYSKVLYNVFIMGMVAPLQIITTFGLLKLLNIIGSYFAVIMVFSAYQIPWSVFIFCGFIKTIPREMDEAAFVDGAKPVMLFFKVILPLLKPVLATTIVIFSMSVWNDFMIPLYFFNTSEKWPMPLTVYNFFGQYFSNWNYVFADLVLTALPVTILYLCFQRYIIAGMTAGAVKG